MDGTLSHPAVAVAVDLMKDRFGGGFAPVGFVARDQIAAVVLDNADARFTIFVEDLDGRWTAPSYIGGASRPSRPRKAHTSDHCPLDKFSRKRFTPHASGEGRPDAVWFAVTGLAALDAVSVSVISELDEQTAPVDENGLAFVVVRALPDEQPRVYVHTRDGRSVADAQPR